MTPPAAKKPIPDITVRAGARWQGVCRLSMALFALAGVVLAVTSMRLKSVTYDETSHLAAGLTYWRTGDFRMTPDHPPLVQLLAASPLLAMDLQVPSTEELSWRLGVVWKYGRDLLNHPNDVEAMLYWGRMPMVGLWCAGGLLAGWWSWRLFGPGGGAVTAGLYFLSPNLIAHGRLVTTDTAAGVFFVASLWSACALLEEITWKRLTAAALCLAGLFLSKFSAPLILPVAGLLGLGRVFGRQPWRVRLVGRQEASGRAGRALLLLATGFSLTVTTMLAIWAVFGFRYAVSPDVPAGSTAHLIKPPRVYDPGGGLSEEQRATLVQLHGRDDLGVWEQMVSPSPATGKLILAARDLRLLPEAYLYGLAYTVRSTAARAAFLLGEQGETGWWYYFPVAWAIKTPLPTMGVIILSLWLAFRRGSSGRGEPGRQRALLALWLFIAVYLWTAMTGKINLGLRHLIPVQMTAFILCGSCGALLSERRRWLRGVLPALLACLAWATVWAWPDYIPYFNTLAGGSRNGWQYLSDSNVDWGQDLPRLAGYLRERGAEKVKLAYFGSGRPEYYGIRASYFAIPFELAALDGGPPGPPADLTPGTYAVSVTALQGWNLPEALCYWDDSLAALLAGLDRRIEAASRADVPADDPEFRDAVRRRDQLRYAQLLAGLRARRPDHMIGKSILIYRLSEADLKAILGARQAAAPSVASGP